MTFVVLFSGKVRDNRNLFYLKLSTFNILNYSYDRNFMASIEIAYKCN